MMDRKVALEEFGRVGKDGFETGKASIGGDEVVFSGGNHPSDNGNSGNGLPSYDGLHEMSMMNQFVQSGLAQEGKKRAREEDGLDTDWSTHKMLRQSAVVGGPSGVGVVMHKAPASSPVNGSVPRRTAQPTQAGSDLVAAGEGNVVSRQMQAQMSMMNGMPASLISQIQQQQQQQPQQQFFYPPMYPNVQQQQPPNLPQQLFMQQQHMFFPQLGDGATAAIAVGSGVKSSASSCSSKNNSSNDANGSSSSNGANMMYGYPPMATASAFPQMAQQQFPMYYVPGPQGLYATPFNNMIMPQLSSMATLSQLQNKFQNSNNNNSNARNIQVKAESVGPQRRSDGDKRRGPIGKSRYRGVSWHKRDRKWIARVWVKQSEENNFQGRMENLGGFVCEMEAAKAVDRRKLELYGKDNPNLKLNFPLNNNNK